MDFEFYMYAKEAASQGYEFKMVECTKAEREPARVLTMAEARVIAKDDGPGWQFDRTVCRAKDMVAMADLNLDAWTKARQSFTFYAAAAAAFVLNERDVEVPSQFWEGQMVRVRRGATVLRIKAPLTRTENECDNSWISCCHAWTETYPSQNKDHPEHPWNYGGQN